MRKVIVMLLVMTVAGGLLGGCYSKTCQNPCKTCYKGENR